MIKRAAKNTRQGKGDCPSTVAGRIEYIADKMRALQWHRMGGAAHLAKAWGLPLSTVKNYSSEASRVVAREVTDPDLVSQTVGGLLMQALIDAAEDAQSMRGMKEGLTARDQIARLGRTWADIAGSMPAQKVEITGALTPAKAREIVAERFGKVTPKSKDD